MDSERMMQGNIAEEEQGQHREELLHRPLVELPLEDLRTLRAILVRKLDETNAELLAVIRKEGEMRAAAEEAEDVHTREKLEEEAHAWFRDESAKIAAQYLQYRDKLDIVLQRIAEKEKEVEAKEVSA